MPDWLPPILIVSGSGALIGIGVWVGHVNADRDSFKAFMLSIRDKLDTILLHMTPKTVERNSPLRLNEFGKRVAKEMAAERWAAGVAELLLSQAKGLSEFQVDHLAQQHVSTALTDKWQAQVRWAAYQFGISQHDVRAVLQIMLRKELIRRAGISNSGPPAG